MSTSYDNSEPWVRRLRHEFRSDEKERFALEYEVAAAEAGSQLEPESTHSSVPPALRASRYICIARSASICEIRLPYVSG